MTNNQIMRDKIFPINSDLKVKADARLMDYANIGQNGEFKNKLKIALNLIDNIRINLKKIKPTK